MSEILTFENLPTQVNLLSIKMDNIEKLLLNKNEQQQAEPQDQLLTAEQTENEASNYATLKQKGGALLKTVLLYLFRILTDYFLMQM